MYRNKKDVDKHVENLISKLSVKEFKTRAYSVARLYYEVGDYASCQRYVEQYLTQKDNNAAAYKLLGQALHKLGQKEKALEQYKTSLDIDPTQTSTILDICELLVGDEINIDLGRAKYWCEKAEATFPRHPITFRLREKLVSVSNPNPEALVNLLTAELAISPKDPLLHARLLKHYIHTNQIKEAVNHSCNVEYGEKTFRYNYAWYESLAELLKHNSHNYNDWLFQLLLLTVRERMCILSLTDTPSSSKSLNEANELLFLYDQDIEKVYKAGVTPGYGEFHASLLQHHRGQFVFHAATLLLKKAKKDQLSWSIATQCAGPLMLMSWHTTPTNTKANWLSNAPEKQQQAAHRWYYEGAYRCSQAGHYLISNSQDKNQTYIDQISQCCSGTHWRDKMYEKLFTSRPHLAKITSSHFVASGTYNTPILRLPRKIEVEAFDAEAQMEYSNSLHHFVWILLHYKNFAHFKCSIFDALTPSATNSGPESMNKIDIQAFLYCSALTSKHQKPNNLAYVSSDKPMILPANITDLLCTLSQLKWWDCAYKFSQNELGAELTDIRGTLSRGIEVVRCIDSHGLDPELLCHLGRIFSEKSKLATEIEEKNNLGQRAGLYYSSAIPLLEKLKSKIVIKLPEKRMFDYTHKELSSKELNSLIEESKLFVAMKHINESEYDNAIGLLSSLKSPEAQYHLSQTFRKLALDENNPGDKYVSLLLKAKTMAYKALDGWKNSERHKNNPLFSDTQELIDELDSLINKIDPDLSVFVVNDVEGKNSSNENVSLLSCDHTAMQSKFSVFRNLSSTPKAPTNSNNITNYRTAVDNQILESTHMDQQYLERIETEIKNLQKRDTTINNFMEETKKWFEENRKLGNEIITTIQSNIQNTTDQFKLLKISVDQVKGQIDECRNECKDVGELKKQIAEMKKEITKLKKTSTDQNIDESDLYNLEDNYRTSESTSTFTPQIPFVPPVLPSFNQRLVPPFSVPPNPYHLYNQNLYNLYSQYSQFGQPSQVPGAPPMFDPNRGQVNYPGVYPTPEAMYLDVAQLVQQPIPAAPAVSIPSVQVAASLTSVQSIPTVSSVSAPAQAATVSTTKAISKIESKDIPRSLPVNVVITSSDPLPTYTTIPTPILSVTIPSKHIKGSPHNYQIPMPVTTDTKVIPPPVFSFPSADNKLPLNKTGNTSNNSWSQVSAFKTAVIPDTAPVSDVKTESLFNNSKNDDLFEISKSVVDGVLNTSNVSHNKSRTLSEKSNTSVEYDPCPDFQPIIPLPAEVTVTTGEEDETIIFSSRAKLFRFVDKQWKERGLGEIKLLKHKVTGKVRVLMRREQIHKICANHIITSNMEIKPMKNETKAYFWVANDFADETVVLEKFCVRFKTAEIATQFYEKFEEARKKSSSSNESDKGDLDEKCSPSQLSEKPITPVKNNSDLFGILQLSKPGITVGGFTFSSTPSFKPVIEKDKAESKPAESSANKANIFSSFSFKSNTSTSFGNIFSAPISQSVFSTEEKETSAKLNTSDTVEEFEPNVEFEPVVPLPALIDQKTGEEDEIILFEHRAKLLRFDSTSKEWKERGLGNIKLLVHKDNVQKVRLIMRREQIMKVCCNHALSKEMTFQKMPNMDKAVTWCAKDFSDGELISETFCLRFKTVQTCDDFIIAVKAAQSRMKDDTKAAKEELNAAKQNTQIGFGDQFKPKPGAWNCTMCYTNNLESFNKCACCEQPKPQTGSISNTIATVTNISTIVPPKTATVLAPTDWGDAFKPKPGTWECKECLVRNEATTENCSACNSAKDPSAIKSGKVASGDGFKFKFGVSLNNPEPTKNSSVTGVIGWGDKFKPKEGSWECQQCLVRNEADSKNCGACSSPKDPSAVSTESNTIFGTSSSGPKFSFGIPANSANTITTQSSNQTSSIFDGTGAHKFSFGIPSATENNSPNIVTFGDQIPQSRNVIFATPKAPDNQGPLNFSLKINDQGDINVTPKVEAQKKESTQTQFGGTFDFVFKPKTPPKGKSPSKSPKTQNDEESDDNEYASEDEGHHIHFSPVIPLPDKVEVVTGEENENELYGHRAKLFRFVSGEWKERGIGVVKILKHKNTGNLRVVMRREQVLKICLNHALTADITYTPKDDKTWLFAANDFSEGELSLQQFCLRFKSKEIATEFKQAIENARGNKTQETVTKGDNNKKQESSDPEDVVFINEIQASAEEKQKAKELMLPENFFTYKTKEPCKGCRGCDLDDVKASTKTAIVSSGISTPLKTSIPLFSSPANSFYGTPTNFDKTTDVSLFRTPLGSLGSNTNTSSSLSANSTLTKNDDTTNKENSFAQKPNSLSSMLEQKIVFDTLPNKPNDATKITDTQTPTSTKISGILAPPKLSPMAKIGEEKQSADPKSLFAAAQSNSMFGKSNSLFGNFNTGTENKSVFGFTAANVSDDTEKQNINSVFSGDNQTPVNLFIGNSSGSLFGPGALSSSQTKPIGSIFGTGAISTAVNNTNASTNVFGNSKAVFGSSQAPTWTLNAGNDQKKPDVTPQKESTIKMTEEPKLDTEDKKDTLFKVDNSLSFAALSSSGPGFNLQKKADFQWEGAGQQLFSAAQKEAADAQKNESGAADDTVTGADEEYDPHYEPIVPLPDKIVVTTGEEDEEKFFGERCRLYRYDEKSREWKERGVGEMKVLYHPERKTYRLLLRREQVHKAVLNMLIFMDLELLPMKNSDRAWTWAGRNYAETAAGEQETLAARFKSVDLATGFRDKVVECVRKLQATAAQAIREEKESTETPFTEVAPLRLPKHLQDSARADKAMSAKAEEHTQSPPIQFQPFFNMKTETKPNGQTNKPTEVAEVSRQVHFEEPTEEEEEEQDEDGYEHDYNEDYDGYYNEEDEESAPYYACEGSAFIQHGTSSSTCDNAHIQVLFDQEMYSPKILVTDADTGEILADMLIHTDTEFQMSGDSCTWTGTDYTSNEPVDKTVTLNFQDSDTTMEFYDSCETSKAATYSSTDQET